MDQVEGSHLVVDIQLEHLNNIYNKIKYLCWPFLKYQLDKAYIIDAGTDCVIYIIIQLYPNV